MRNQMPMVARLNLFLPLGQKKAKINNLIHQIIKHMFLTCMDEINATSET